MHLLCPESCCDGLAVDEPHPRAHIHSYSLWVRSLICSPKAVSVCKALPRGAKCPYASFASPLQMRTLITGSVSEGDAWSLPWWALHLLWGHPHLIVGTFEAKLPVALQNGAPNSLPLLSAAAEALQCKVCKYRIPFVGCFRGGNETTCERKEKCAIIKTSLGT